jgi:hypothetical protein
MASSLKNSVFSHPTYPSPPSPSKRKFGVDASAESEDESQASDTLPSASSSPSRASPSTSQTTPDLSASPDQEAEPVPYAPQPSPEVLQNLPSTSAFPDPSSFSPPDASSSSATHPQPRRSPQRRKVPHIFPRSKTHRSPAPERSVEQVRPFAIFSDMARDSQDAQATGTGAQPASSQQDPDT